MTAPRPSNRSGFSLAELAVTVMIVGILAGVALPNLRRALLDAEAGRIVTDARTVSLAAYEYLADNGTFPGSGPYGSVPAQLQSYLPDGFAFEANNVRYGWISFTLPSANNIWQTRTLGLFIVDYSNRRDLATPMQRHMGGDRYWSSSMFYFLYAG